MNRNPYVAQPNATATAWLGGRNYDWLSNTSPPTTTSVAVRVPKRRRTNPQPASPTSSHLARPPSDSVANNQPKSPDPVHPDRPPSAKRANTAPDPPRAGVDSPQESRQQDELHMAQDLHQVKQESSATCPESTVALADATGRLPTPRNSTAPLAAEGPSPPPSRAPEETTPNVPTPTSSLPSPQAPAGYSPKYACFDRQACLENVHRTRNSTTLTTATRTRCYRLQQAMENNDHEYMLLHQYMSMAEAGQMPNNAPMIKESMSHLASITTVAFGEPVVQSSLKDWFCDLPLPLKTLHERDRAHYTYHNETLRRHCRKLAHGWKTFEDSRFPFTVPDFQSVLGLHSPQWQRLANMAKIRLLIQSLGIRIEVAKEHQFESRLMELFQTHQARVHESNADAAEVTKFRHAAAEVIEKMKSIPGPNQPPRINLDFHQPEQIPRQVDNGRVVRQQQEHVVRQQQFAAQRQRQQSEQIARHRQRFQEQTGQRQATASQQHSERLRHPIIQSPVNAQNTMGYNMVADAHNIYFNQAPPMGQPMSTPQDPRHQPHQFYQSPVQSPIQYNQTIQRHQPTPSHSAYHRHPSPVQTSRVHSPAQFHQTIPQQGMQEQMGQYMTQDFNFQRRASGNGIPHGMVPQAQQQASLQAPLQAPQQLSQQAPQQVPQQLPSSRRDKLFQSVVDFVIPPQRLGGALGYDFEFEISPEDVANIPRKVGNVDEQTVVYRLRCIQVPSSGDLQKEWMSTPTTWPTCTLLTINGSHLRPQRKQDKWGAVLLCPFIKSSINKFSIETIRGPEEPASSTFAVAVEKIKFQTRQTISSLVTSPERVVSAASVLSSIRSAINPEATDDKDSGDELAVTMSRITINLVDPQSASRICEVPVRSAACHHRDCFDLATFLASRPGIVTGVDEWRCPICRADARPANLIVDGFLTDVRRQLESRGELDTAKAIIVEADGSWSVREETRGQSEKRARSATAGNTTQNESSAPAATSASASGGLFCFSTNETGLGAPAWLIPEGLDEAEVAEAVKTINSLGLVTQSNATPSAATATASSISGTVNEPIIIDLSDDDD